MYKASVLVHIVTVALRKLGWGQGGSLEFAV